MLYFSIVRCFLPHFLIVLLSIFNLFPLSLITLSFSLRVYIFSVISFNLSSPSSFTSFIHIRLALVSNPSPSLQTSTHLYPHATSSCPLLLPLTLSSIKAKPTHWMNIEALAPDAVLSILFLPSLCFGLFFSLLLILSLSLSLSSLSLSLSLSPSLSLSLSLPLSLSSLSLSLPLSPSLSLSLLSSSLDQIEV